jgi:hypothetical protein
MHEVIKVERETYEKVKLENELLKEELQNLKNDITRVYNTMISLQEINKHELSQYEEIEEI